MALNYLRRKNHDDYETLEARIAPHLGPEPGAAKTEVFDTGRKTIVDCAHVRVERLDTHPVLFSKVFKEFEDRKGQKYDYRYWAERENFFLREFLKKQAEFTHVVQARHLISENEAAKQVLTCDAGITVADWLRVKPRYADSATLSHPFQRSDALLRLLRASLVALKEIHAHRIVHCDIKEDNICIPYAPAPYPGEGRQIHLEFEQLKLIDFAFSIAHAIPLTQILVIDPDERVPYQSELLISALLADRRSGSPNAVQQLDYRVDLFSLGYMAEKICAAGLVSPPGSRDRPENHGVLEEVRSLVQKLKGYELAPGIGPAPSPVAPAAPSPAALALPHDGLIAEIDRLLLKAGGLSGSLEFRVDGEWTVEEMARETEHGRDADRKTPLTPVALPLPTPIALPLTRAPYASGRSSGIRMPLLVSLALAVAGSGTLLYRKGEIVGAPTPSSALIEQKEIPAAQPLLPKASVATDMVSLLRSDEDAVFQAAFRELTRLMTSDEAAAAAIAKSIATEYGDVLASSGPRASRLRALGRLVWMAKAGNRFAAERVAAFEKTYDEVKQTVATSVWWARGAGPRPDAATRWLEDGELLAESGDRPAMLDLAFAMGHGRALKQDRVTSVETYLKVIARSDGGDELSARIRQSAARGLAAILDIIVEHEDQDAAQRVLSVLESKVNSGAVDMESARMRKLLKFARPVA